MKRISTLILALFAILYTNAQTTTEIDTSWKKGGFIGLNFTQVGLSQWYAGGENSLALAGNVNLFDNYAKGKITWDNTLDLNYALLQSGTADVRKSDDRIDFTSKYGRKIKEGSKWYYAALLNFKSQFTDGFAYPNDSVVVSKFLAPGYLILSLGLDFKPNDFLSFYLSPVTGKFTFVTDADLNSIGAYGVDTGKTVRSEFGAYLNMKFKKDIMENVTFSTKLELFNNYTDKDKDNAKRIDVNWETALMMKVNKYLTAGLNTILIYDHNQIQRTQFKEVIGVGFGYKF